MWSTFKFGSTIKQGLPNWASPEPSILNAMHYSKEMPGLRPHMQKYPNNAEQNVQVGALKGDHFITIKELGPFEPEFIRDH